MKRVSLVLIIFSSTLLLFIMTFNIISDILIQEGMKKPSLKRHSNQGQYMTELNQKVYVDFEELYQPIVNLDPKCPRWNEMAQAFRRCLQQQIMTQSDLWFHLHTTLKLCGSDLIKHILHVKYLVNKDDVKLLVQPDHKNTPCTSVTIGIGNDTSAELRLRQLLPSTEFYGADPIEESGKIFSSLGHLTNTAIAPKSGQLNASVLMSGKYSWKMVEAMTLTDYINSLPVQNIDFLFIDAEGVEYDIIPQIEFINEKTPICQISLELHGPLEKYGQSRNKFSRIMTHLLTDTSFVGIWSPIPLMHNRIFLLNWRSSYCINKFLHRWC